MLKTIQKISLTALIFLAAGCTSQDDPNAADNTATKETTSESDESTPSENTAETENKHPADHSGTNDSNEDTDTNDSVESSDEPAEATNPLEAYSTEEIEYARIYLQFGPNPDIEELYAEHIPEGTQMNPLDEGSLNYPEDVVRLSGSRLVDGAVTYSSNGDGTINIYNVPKRWENPETYNHDSSVMEETTREIINNTETVYVEPGNGEDVAEMASRIK